MHILYLHGFASSPQSTKANTFKPAFEQRGVQYHIPDLNVPDFEHLTLTAMLDKVAQTIRALKDEQPVVLIGSSMGGLTALHFWDRYKNREAKRVQKLVLLAPAFDFMDNRTHQMGEGWQEAWRKQGAMPFFNYAMGGERMVHYGLVEDIQQYDSYQVQPTVPVLIYHGKQDASVPYDQSERFAQARPTVTLRLLDSDHQMLDKTDVILAGMLEFLGLAS